MIKITRSDPAEVVYEIRKQKMYLKVCFPRQKKEKEKG